MKATLVASGSTYNELISASAGWVAYRCEPPYLGQHEHVRVSAATIAGEPETYIFPCDADGRVTDWGELDGSIEGVRDLSLLSEMGYEVTP
jgi:hypothetical protein